MPDELNDIKKLLNSIDDKVTKLDSKSEKEFLAIKKTLKTLDQKIGNVLDKIQEFEIVLDAAEMLENHIEEEEERYNTDWSPYDDEDFQSEDYEDYDDYR